MAAVGNAIGIGVFGPDNTIGGAGTGNVISGNTIAGLQIAGATTARNAILGNYIGTNAAGAAAVSNFRGIVIEAAAFGNRVGGETPGAGNLISGNVNTGVLVSGTNTRGNILQGNRIGTKADGKAALANGMPASRSTIPR